MTFEESLFTIEPTIVRKPEQLSLDVQNLPDFVEDLWLVDRYLDVICNSSNPDQVNGVANLYSDLFRSNSRSNGSWEINTNYLVRKLRAERGEDDVISYPWSLKNHRISAVRHLVRSMIQGNRNYPVELFPIVIQKAENAILQIDPTLVEKNGYKRELHTEVVSTFHSNMNSVARMRSEAALETIGLPKVDRAILLAKRALEAITDF